jgi:hypothetical protein
LGARGETTGPAFSGTACLSLAGGAAGLDFGFGGDGFFNTATCFNMQWLQDIGSQ